MYRNPSDLIRLATLSAVSAVLLYSQVGQTIGPADATTPVSLAPGAPLGSYALNGFEQVSLYTGHLNVSLPLLNIGGRGSARFQMMALISSPSWSITTESKVQPLNGAGYEYQYTNSGIEEDWHTYTAGYGPGILVTKRSGTGVTIPADNSPAYFASGFTYIVFIQPDGTEIGLYDTKNNGSPLSHGSGDRGKRFHSRDGLGITFVSNADVSDNTNLSQYPNASEQIDLTGTLHWADGTCYDITNGLVTTIRDRNGNTITFSYIGNTTKVETITDASSRVYTVSYSVRTSGVCAGCVEDEIKYPGTGGAERKIIVTRGNPSGRLRPPLTMPPLGLFPESNVAVYGPYERIVRVKLHNATFYDVFFTPYGEVARIVLPTSGVIDYEHGAGLKKDEAIKNAKGVYASGQVLDTIPGVWKALSGGSQPTSIPDPPWHPYVYRRLLSRKEYPSGVDTAVARTQSYELFETALSVASSSQYNGVISGVSLQAQDAIKVFDKDENRGTEDVESHYFHTKAVGFPIVADPAEGPTSELTTVSPRYAPDPFQGKEYKTETAGLQRIERVYSQGVDGVALPCQENVRWLVGDLTRTQLFYYDRNETLGVLPLDEQFNNRTDVYEFDFGSAKTINSDTYLNQTRFLCVDTPGNGYLRRVHVDYKVDHNNDTAYTSTPVHLQHLPSKQQTMDSGGTVKASTSYLYDETVPDACSNIVQHSDAVIGNNRGNPTTIKKLLKYGSDTDANISETFTYDVAGNIRSHTNGRSKTTEFTFTNTTKFSFPSTIKNALGHSVDYEWDVSIGRPTSFIDANGNTTGLVYDDPLDRLTSVNEASLRHRSYSYSSSNPITIDATVGGVKTQTVYDGFGRDSLRYLYGDANAVVSKIETQYDGKGRIWKVSNPYTGAAASAWSETTYDALGRVRSIIHPDSATDNIEYGGVKSPVNAITATTTDANSNTNIQYQDSAGRLIRVKEATSGTNALNYITSYDYSVLDDLTMVTQGPQVRTFRYDSLGRLREAENPETGKVTYGYDENGNLTSWVDGRAGFDAFYDDLDRLTKKTYRTVATPAEIRCYDGQIYVTKDDKCIDSVTTGEIGYLTGVGNSNSSMQYRHQGLGLVKWSQQSTGGGDYKFEHTNATPSDGYQYSEGRLTDVYYPSGRHVTYTYDAAGRVKTAGGYVTDVQYDVVGPPKQITFGNGMVETISFNNRLQVKAIEAAKNGSMLKLENFYCAAEAASCVSNNGNVISQRQTIGGISWPTAFTYDGVNRLTGATETPSGASGWSQTYSYGNQYGNMTVTDSVGVVPSGLICNSYQQPANKPVNNQCTSATFGYDLSGNLNSASGRSMIYDAANRQVQLTDGGTTQYVYDGEGRRVQKVSGSQTTTYVYDAMGQLAAEYGGSTANGPGCYTCYMTSDHLGSTRLVTDEQGLPVRRWDYTPFGWEINASYGKRPQISGYVISDSVQPKFTGKLRDYESGLGLDYFGARYFSGAQGRFTSPDKVFVDQHIEDPQSWNLYSYVRNNPLVHVDDGNQLHPYQALQSALPSGQRRMTPEESRRLAPYASGLALAPAAVVAAGEAAAVGGVWQAVRNLVTGCALSRSCQEAIVNLMTPPGVTLTPGVHIRDHEIAAAEEFARREGVHLVQPAAQSLSDFVGASGKLAGKTIDFMFTSPNTSRSAGSAWVKAENSFFEHVAKYDVVVLQMRNLSKAQIADVMRWIGALSSEDQAKIKYLN